MFHKSAFLLALLAGATFTAPAFAGEYVFVCRHELWRTEQEVTVEAESIEAARKEIKRNKTRYEDLSMCQFRREIPPGQTKRRKAPEQIPAQTTMPNRQTEIPARPDEDTEDYTFPERD